MPADPPDRPLFEPDAVAGKSFTQARRGYEPDEVRAFLLSVASQIREAKLRYEDMERRLVEVERRAADPKDLDETAVTQLLGEETARVLETARNAAADIRNRAETAAVAREAEITERDRATREAADQYSEQVRTAADEADRRIRTDAE
ncbi:MAG: DivIVA domain-containing protein, partial [Acidimicrobiales bacterium]|nr:DivIVA domain-containing protein [Acidimicrobiales bacterium]